MLRRFIAGASYGVLAGIAGKILFSLSSIVVARVLGAHDYGVYVNVMAFVNVLSIVCLFGIHTAFSAFVPHYVQTNPAHVRSVIVAGFSLVAFVLLAVGVGVLVSAEHIAALVYDEHIAGAILRFALIILCGIVLNTAAMAVVYGFQEFRQYALLTIASSALVMLLAVIGAFTFGVQGVIVGSGVAYVFSASIVGIVIEPRIERLAQGSVGGWKESLREILRFAVPTFLSGIFVAPAYWIGNFLMTQAGDTSSSGYFGVASALAQVVLFVPTTLAAPLIPILSEVHAQGEEGRFASLVLKNVRLVWLATLPLAASFGIAAFAVVTMVYGASYAPAVKSFMILLGVNTLIAVEGVLGNVLIAKKQMWGSFVANLLWFSVFIILALLFVRRGGHVEFAFSLLCAYGIFGVVIAMMLRRHVKFDGASRAVLPLALLTLIVFSVLWWMGNAAWHTGVKIVAALLFSTLLGVIEWQWFVSPDERALAREAIHNVLGKYFGRSEHIG
ncbi:MAG: hypothetical protein C4326_06895 [Ignavibacteria bacterium]